MKPLKWTCNSGKTRKEPFVSQFVFERRQLFFLKLDNKLNVRGLCVALEINAFQKVFIKGVVSGSGMTSCVKSWLEGMLGRQTK